MSRTPALVVAVASVLSSLQAVDAGIAIWGGAGTEVTAAEGGQTQAGLPVSPGRPINESGATISYARLVGPNSANLGFRSFRSGPMQALKMLNTIEGSDREVSARAINSSGTVVGEGILPNGAGLVAVRWMPGTTTPQILPQPNVMPENRFLSYEALDLNDSGTIIGRTELFEGEVYVGARGVRWTGPNATPALLQPISLQPGTRLGLSRVAAINPGGTVVGESTRFGTDGRDLGARATRWSSVSNVGFELAHLGTNTQGVTNSSAAAVNRGGLTVGGARRWDGDNDLGFRATRWNAGASAVVELGHLGVDANGFTAAIATGVNDSGTVIGRALKFNDDGGSIGFCPVRWDANATTAIRLNGIGTRVAGFANAINNSGTVVGAIFETFNPNTTADYRGVLWRAGETQAIDLTSRLDPQRDGHWTINEALALTNTGFVTGRATFDPDGPAGARAGYGKVFTMLVPEAGTYGRGDANFDGQTNFSDLVILAQNYNRENAERRADVADLNLDGRTNFADLVLLAQNYNTPTPANVSVAFAAEWALAQSMVPEPAAGMLVGMVAAVVGMRRR